MSAEGVVGDAIQSLSSELPSEVISLVMTNAKFRSRLLALRDAAISGLIAGLCRGELERRLVSNKQGILELAPPNYYEKLESLLDRAISQVLEGAAT